VPIIIEGGSRCSGSWWSKHLGNEETNEQVQVIEYRDLSATTNNPTIQQPLSDDELNRLGGFLDEIGPLAMNMESLDGYFPLRIAGPSGTAIISFSTVSTRRTPASTCSATMSVRP
jgi:hypothetical protein